MVVMAVKAGTDDITMVHIFSRYGRKSDRVSVAGIALRLNRNMVLRPAARNIVVVAAKARPLHKIMIHNHRLERDRAVAAATFHGGANMVHVLAHGVNAVMAGDAVFSHVAMTEMRRLPTEG